MVVHREIEQAFASNEDARTKLDSYVQQECRNELEALKEAQERLNDKLKEVNASKQKHTLDESVYNSDARLHKEMRHMQRNLQQTLDVIQDDLTLDSTERQRRLRELTQEVQTEYTRLSKAYPATMRAQMLRNLSIM